MPSWQKAVTKRSIVEKESGKPVSKPCTVKWSTDERYIAQKLSREKRRIFICSMKLCKWIKTMFAGMESSQIFHEKREVLIEKKYNADEIQQRILNGD